MSELIARYKVACKEAARLESLLNRGHIKSLQDFRRLQHARQRRDDLALQVEKRSA